MAKMLARILSLIYPPCPACNGAGGAMSGYYEPEFSECRCCNENGDNGDDPTRVWQPHWWLYRFNSWRENRRLDKWCNEEMRRMDDLRNQ